MHLWRSARQIIKAAELDPALVPQTRVSPWRSPDPEHIKVWIKHEDECSHAITAGKMRKYASLLPWMRNEGIHTACVFGSANSNHVVAACQLLLQYGIRPVPFLKPRSTKGANQLLLRLLVDEAEWRILPKVSGLDLIDLSTRFIVENMPEGDGKLPIVEITEGACLPPALAGAMTLAEDIARNQRELGLAFSDIFIDAGTGLSAAGLALGMKAAGLKARLHVTLMADSEEVFRDRLPLFAEWYRSVFRRKANPAWQDCMIFHKPKFGASFGSVNASVIKAIKEYARLGLLTDPIYSAKHLATAEHIIKTGDFPMENVLIIHSGGAQSLQGYAHLL